MGNEGHGLRVGGVDVPALEQMSWSYRGNNLEVWYRYSTVFGKIDENCFLQVEVI